MVKVATFISVQDVIDPGEDAAGDGVRGDGDQDPGEPGHGQLLVQEVIHRELPGAGPGPRPETQRQVPRSERSVMITRFDQNICR